MILLSHSQSWSQTLLVLFQLIAERFVSNLLYLRNCTISGVARTRSLVGHKYGKWSLTALSLTTPRINTAESQSLAYNLDYFCPILTELKG